MKKNIVFVLVVALIVTGLYQLSKNGPLDLTWERSYRTSDPQPYGGEALDKLLKASWQEGYEHSYERFDNLYEDSLIQDKNLLIICDNLYMPESEIGRLIEYLQKGGNALIASQHFHEEWCDVWGIDTESYGKALSSSRYLENLLQKGDIPNDTVLFHRGLSIDSITTIPLPFLPVHFVRHKLDYSISAVASNSEDEPIILRVSVGEGNLILSCSPLLFTNYSLLNDSIRPFFEQSMAYLKGKPLIRTEYYKVGSQEKQGEDLSVFRVLKANPSSRWAYYLIIVGVLLFMVFTAKRKQKVIPIIDPPKNRIIDFVDSITGLYLSRNNNADILQKRYVYWAEEMHKKYGIDIINEEHTPSFYNKFATKTGMNASDARQLILTLESMKYQPEISDKELMDIITTLNRL